MNPKGEFADVEKYIHVEFPGDIPSAALWGPFGNTFRDFSRIFLPAIPLGIPCFCLKFQKEFLQSEILIPKYVPSGISPGVLYEITPATSSDFPQMISPEDSELPMRFLQEFITRFLQGFKILRIPAEISSEIVLGILGGFFSAYELLSYEDITLFLDSSRIFF